MPNSPAASVRLVVNGQATTVVAHPLSRLLDVLRHDLHLTGTKEGCGEGECGACSVLVDGQLVNSCLTPVLQVDGAPITTIEGIAPDDGRLHALQQAFFEHGGAQCGICTPGMVLAAVSLGLAGNLCRCTGYMGIFKAVREGAKELQAQGPGPKAQGPS
jgi:carbon-monoxide dehydrogenase small subunit